MSLPIPGLRPSLALLLLGLGVTGSGCLPFGDPGGPGVSGNASLGSSVQPASFQLLRLRAVPDDAQSAFDPAAPAFPPASATVSTADEDETWTIGQEELTGMTFPHAYELSGALGTTEHQHWRLFLWLSQSSTATAPASGEPYGTVAFTVAGCGSYGGYCGVTTDTNVTLDQTAP